MNKELFSVKDQAVMMPNKPGVYLMKSQTGVILYIGKAKILRNRVKSYFTKQKGRSLRLKHLIKQIIKIDYVITTTEVEAFLLEASLIKKHKPRYNIRLKDDKSYPYIKCSLSEEFPRFYVSRKVSNNKEDLFYGPFTSGFLVRENIKFLNGVYKTRDCSNGFMKIRKRPCLTHEIKRCTAPCVGMTTQRKYKNQVKKAIAFLEGDTKEILKEVEKNMYKASLNQEFERAAEYRDQLEGVKIILEKQTVIAREDINRDVVSYVTDEKGSLISMIHTRKGRVLGQKIHFLNKLEIGVKDENLREKVLSFLNQYYIDNFIPDEILLDQDLGSDLTRLFKDVLKERSKQNVDILHVPNSKTKAILNMARKNALEHLKKYIEKFDKQEKALFQIKEKFGLLQIPERIECYDISNFQGDQSVGSQVVFNAGAPSPQDYRIYKIKTIIGPDDFNSLKEVLVRRFSHSEYQDPQLIVIDGGKGQLSKVVSILKDLGRQDLVVVGLAKSREKGNFKDSKLKRTSERFFISGRANPVTFKLYSQGLRILTNIRDEAHRFAIAHHRKLRDKKMMESVFSKIPGFGPKKQARLKQLLKTSSDWTLITEKKIMVETKTSAKVAKEILVYLHVMVKKK